MANILDSELSILRNGLFDKTITPSDFLDRVLQLDQQTPTHVASLKNIALLEDPEVVQALGESEEASVYHNLLSLSHFHVGQTVAGDGLLDDARHHLNRALAEAQLVEGEGYAVWVQYVQGTLAYLNKDIQALKSVYLQIEDGDNRDILGALLEGLRQRGSIDYKTDYGLKPI